jgi:hypothetical protein
MKFGNEFWLILFQEYISPKLFAVYRLQVRDEEGQGACRKKKRQAGGHEDDRQAAGQRLG